MKIVYETAVAAPGYTEVNLRVDDNGDGTAVLRRGSFLSEGVRYEIDADQSFATGGIAGAFLFSDAPGKAKLVTLDPQAMRMALLGPKREFRVHGKLAFALMTVTMVSGSKEPRLQVVRCLKEGEPPADSLPPVHSEQVAAGSFTVPSPAPPAPTKTWEEMSQQERDAALREAAVKLGLVKPS